MAAARAPVDLAGAGSLRRTRFASVWTASFRSRWSSGLPRAAAGIGCPERGARRELRFAARRPAPARLARRRRAFTDV